MKIICMDCQTESHVAPEMVKGKQLIECAQCAEDSRVKSESQIADTVALTAYEEIGVNPDSIHEQLPEGEIQWVDDEDVLDISVVPFAPAYPAPAKADDLISLAPEETKALALFDETPVPEAVHDSEEAFENYPVESISQPLAENIVQPLPEPMPAPEAPAPVALAETHVPEAKAVSLPAETKKVSLLAFSVPKLITISAVLVLFISLAGMLNFPGGEVSLKAQSPAPAALNPPEKKIEQKTAAATSVPVAEISEPAPQPEPAPSQETVSAATTPSANQPVVSEPMVNQPAVSEPAPAGEGKITVQVGSHNQMNLAESQAEKLRAAGYEPRVVSVEIPKRGRWYRVQVGNFPDRPAAQQFGSQLVSKGVIESFVIAEK